jgi:DNA-binding IclR family transcriptional regulator
MRNNGGVSGETQNANPLQSVDRALTILEILARHGELGVTGIAGELDVHKSTASRLVGALEAHRLVEQMGDRGKYRLGFGIVRLAGATTARLSLPRQSRPMCRRLAAELGETVNVAVLDGTAVVNVAQEQGNAAISAHNWLGQRTPAHATSSGKVLLAWATDAERTAIVDAGLTKYTENTITDSAELDAELEEIRQRGWASTSEELEIGLNAVAAPIRDADGVVVGAISVSGPSYRLAASAFEGLAERVLVEAEAISLELGYFPQAATD